MQIDVTENIETQEDNTEKKELNRITKEDIKKAQERFAKFQKGKASVDQRVIDNEEWFNQRHWQFMKRKKDAETQPQDVIEPTSAWMFNSLFNKHADAMDNYPTCNFLPREETDTIAAEELSAIVPVILEQNGHKSLYNRSWWYLLKFGTLIEATLWDKRKYYGMGDVSITRIDILNFFPEPNVLDIQDSSDIFYVHLKDKEQLLAEYPHLNPDCLHNGITLKRYAHEDAEISSEKTCVVDWYYKKYTENGSILHFCQFVGDEIIYSTENDPKMCDSGLYAHGLYPFDITQLFPVETSIFSFGFIDIMRSPQAYIDRLDQTILTNAAKISNPKTLIDKNLGINLNDLADGSKNFIEFSGNLSNASYQQIAPGNLPAVVLNHYQNKIQELKETSGNRDVNQGSAGSVTSGTAIAALQESGSKGSRDILQGDYTKFESQCKKIASLVGQFYNLPRKFRITNKNGQEQFVEFSNENLKRQISTAQDGTPQYIVPEFDVKIVAQKQNRYTSNANNEMAMLLYNAGFFNPQNSDMALACIDLMTFDNKDRVAEKIRQNGLMYQQIQAMQQQMIGLAQIAAHVTGDARILESVGMQAEQTSDVYSGRNLKNVRAVTGELADNSQAANARRAAQERSSI